MKESHFLTEIRKSFEEESCYAYKIPDMPSGTAFRFNPDKPFDMVVSVNGVFVAVEGKMQKKFEAFGMRHLRDVQIENLEKAKRSNGEAFVFLNIRFNGDYQTGAKRTNRLLIFEWDEFKELTKDGTIKKQQMMDMDFIQGKKGLFDLSGFTSGIKRTA